MVTALVLMATVAGTIPALPGAWLALTWSYPQVSLLFILVLAALARRSAGGGSGSEYVTFHRVIASELRAGLSLRLALAAACGCVPGLHLGHVARLASAGRPLEEVARALSSDGRLRPAAVALRVAATTGGSVAGVFDALTAEAVDEEDLRREQRTLTVQARLSVAMVGGFPLLVLAFQIGSGELRRLMGSGGAGTWMVVVGVLLLVTGLASVFLLLGKARR